MTVIFFGASSFRRGLLFAAIFSPLFVFWFVSSLFGSLSYVPKLQEPKWRIGFSDIPNTYVRTYVTKQIMKMKLGA